MKRIVFGWALAACFAAFAGLERTVALTGLRTTDGGDVAELAISAALSDCDLYLATGRADGGAATGGWERVTFLTTVPALDTSVSVRMPDGLGTDYTHFRFFTLYDAAKDYSTYLVDSITSQSADLHIDTGVLIHGGNINLMRVSITMSALNTTWPVNGISNPQPFFFFGPGQGGQIYYGSGTANVPTQGYYTWGHKATFDLDFCNQTYRVTDLSTDPEKTVLNLTSLTRSGTTGSKTFWIFGYNGEKAQRNMTIFSADFWQNGEPVASIIPAVSNGVVCAYDTLRKVYLLPKDKNETMVKTNLVAGEKLYPEPSSSETYNSEELLNPMLDPVSAIAEGRSVTLTGMLVGCGFGHSTCALFVRTGLAPDALGEPVCVTNDVSSGSFSLALSGLLPRRHYYFSVQAVNADGQASESRPADIAVPSSDREEDGSRPFSVAGVGLVNGQAKTMTLAFEAGDETFLTVCAGDEPADGAGGWAYSASIGTVGAEAQELTFDLPQKEGGDVYRFVRISAAKPLSTLYDHLVDSVVSTNGTRYIDSGVSVNADNYGRFRMKFTYNPTVSGVWNVFGYSGSSGYYFAGVSDVGSSYAFAAFSSVQTDTGVKHQYGDVVTVDLNVDAKHFTVTDETTGEMKVSTGFSPSAPRGDLPMWMLGWSGQSVTRKGALYAAEYWLGGACVRKFHPCVDRDGVACLYDEVTKDLFYSTGSGGELAPGATIPDEGRVCEKLMVASIPGSCPVLATASVMADDVRGNVVNVSGLLSALGAASATDCTLSIVLRANGVDEERTLGSPEGDGTFAFAVEVVPGVTYDWRVVATTASGSDNFQGDAFRMAAETKIHSVSVTSEGWRVNVGVTVDEYGGGETELYLLWGETEATEQRALIGSLNAKSNTYQRYSVDWPGMPRDKSLCYRVVASNLVGTAYAVGTEKAGTVVLEDTGTYTWKEGVVGRWSDVANWTCSQERNWGYPNSPNCGVAFPAGDADVELNGSFTSKTVSWASRANVRFWGTDTNACRYVCNGLGQNTKITLSSAVTVTVERASLVMGTRYEIFDLGQNALLHITRGADLNAQYLQTYQPGCLFKVSDGAVATASDYNLGSGDFIIDNALVVCREFFFVNKEQGVYNTAHLLFRGKNPRLRWMAGAMRDGESFANTSVTKEGVVEFDIPVGGYAETPILYAGTRKDFPFGSFDGYTYWKNRSTPLTIRVANRRGAFGGLPHFQPLVSWSSGIATNFVQLAKPASRNASFVYSDEPDRPKTLGLSYKAGTVLFVR